MVTTVMMNLGVRLEAIEKPLMDIIPTMNLAEKLAHEHIMHAIETMNREGL